ncbi:hypothetical protein NDU88_000291 [Pleurodeles waltl]|uniref:Uncharacterized protein n=1 Tax=Pleurodeles waltl TaxID=8319 RepID=A0AAV7P3J0_PLEWA|nr:hypothetical protein NDU88_000291 [Pleurodeles waltl]
MRSARSVHQADLAAAGTGPLGAIRRAPAGEALAGSCSGREGGPAPRTRSHAFPGAGGWELAAARPRPLLSLGHSAEREPLYPRSLNPSENHAPAGLLQGAGLIQ